MANVKPKSLLLFLLVLVVAESRGSRCPSKCSCFDKRRKSKVDCRSIGLTEVFASEEFPSDMQVLDLSKNNISVIRRGFLDSHSQLEKLFLHRNSIQTLEERAFVGLSKLNRLVLKQNKLVKLKAKAFIGLPNLDALDLGFNKIQSIDKSAFFGFKKLSKLVLNNNSFTTIENGTFDSLTSLRKIDIRNLPLTCDCRLNPFIKFLAKLMPFKELSGSCFGTSTSFKSLLKTNLCDVPPELSIFPENDQVVSVGDSFQMVCKIKDKQNSKLLWEKNEGPIEKGKNILIGTFQPSKFHLERFMNFASVTESVAGIYTCSSFRIGVKSKTIKISVVDASLKMCRRDMIKTDRGPLLWPVAFPGSTMDLDCPSLHQTDVKVMRTCAQDGVWGEVNFGQCPRASLSQKLTKLENSLKRDDFKDIAGVASTLRSLTDPSNFQSYHEVSLAFNVVAGIIRRQTNVPFKTKVLDNMLAIFNNIMDVDEGILYDAERYDRSPSRLGARLELISRRIVDQKLSRVFSNIVIGSVDLKNNVDFQGKTCHVYFKSKDVLQPVGVQCQRRNLNYKNILVSIHVPKTIFENLNSAGLKSENLRVQFLVYKNAKLFPNIISNMTDAVMRGRNVTSSVLAIQMADIKELNLTEPFVMTFATEAGRSPLISHFDFSEKVVGRPWSPNNDCHVNKSSITMTTVDCSRLVNKNLAVMSLLGTGESIVTYPMEAVVYIGAVFASLFILATLITFAAFRNLRFDRDDTLMLMNACLALLVVVTTFAFGIDGVKNNVVCLMVGVFLHFFFLAFLLWLGSYVVCVSRRLEPPKESEEAYNPVLRYYMVSWGVPAIICGITLAGDLKNYRTSKYCWLTESAGLGAFVGPACLLFIVNCVLLVRLHLLLARGSIEPRPSGENSEEERLQGDEPGVLEEAPEPGSQLAAEKSAITLYLVATCVVMSLIYVNFIVAYFLVKSRSVKLAWTLLSYVYALANIALGVSVFSFYCVVRSDVREAWLNAWKRARAKRITCTYPRRALARLWITQPLRRSNAQPQPNGQILLNGEDINLATGKVDSDRQSNITLPSSAALTNDVFVNGRPLSCARVSLLEDADFPPEEAARAGAEVNEVDITEVATSEDGHGRSQGSIHSERRGVSKVPSENTPFPEENLSLPNLSLPCNLFTEVHEETQTDITDGVTSKSESSAPTAIEVPILFPSIDNSAQAYAPTKVVAPAERPTSLSSSSLSEVVPPGRVPNFKRKHSSDSLNSRNESGSIGPRARKYPQLLPQAYLSSSSAISEVQTKDPDPKRQRSSESVNSRGVARNAGPAAGATQRPKNRYKDGREKPEPKAWRGGLGAKIAYVPVPHVSKIHREPSHNETSV